MKNRLLAGHLSALLTIAVWGTTFVSTKVLLTDLAPMEIMLFRLGLAVAALLAIYPKFLVKTGLRRELIFAAAGLCGVTLYFLMENIALTRTMAANVSVIVSLSPFFIALFARLFLGEKTLSPRFFLGFLVSMTGVWLLCFNGAAMELSPAGDLLALGAAAVWAVYSLLIKHINGYGYPIVQTTRRVFLYGLLFLIPALLFSGVSVTAAELLRPRNLLNLLYLGLGASAVCFVTWNWAVKVLGPVKTGAYIYLNPVITVLASALVLPSERLTALSALGIALTLAGLFLSESKSFFEKKTEQVEQNG